MLLRGQLVQGSRTVLPPQAAFRQRAAALLLSSMQICARRQDWKEANPRNRKKAASKEREKAANELLLIWRSSIRETLHSLLTRRCVLKGRTIGTNWTWGIGGVSGCRGRKKGRKKDAPPPSSLLPLSSSTRNVSASVFPSAGGAFLLERES